MAEALLKKYLEKEGKAGISVKSAGVHAFGGAPPTNETVEVMKEAGIDVSGCRSRAVNDELIKEADLVLVMAAHHMDEITARFPGTAAKTHLLRRFGGLEDSAACDDADIPDPIGMDIGFYRKVLGCIDAEMERIAKIL
jgi:protein-tyrosine-phosphatase